MYRKYYYSWQDAELIFDIKQTNESILYCSEFEIVFRLKSGNYVFRSTYNGYQFEVENKPQEAT